MGARSWKSFDWAAMDRLRDTGLISDLASKARSVVLTDTGLHEAEAAFRRLFETDDQATRGADAIAGASSEASRR